MNMFIQCRQKGFNPELLRIRADRIYALDTIEYNGQPYTKIIMDDGETTFVVDEYVRGVEEKISKALQEEAMKPRLVNRGDGVDGHYCIARTRPEGFSEFWNADLKEWCSAGTVIEICE